MTDLTSKVLHEKTGQVLDRARQGERFRILREGRAEAYVEIVERLKADRVRHLQQFTQLSEDIIKAVG